MVSDWIVVKLTSYQGTHVVVKATTPQDALTVVRRSRWEGHETGETQEFMKFCEEVAVTTGNDWWKSPQNVLQYYIGMRLDAGIVQGSILPINVN